ncbi:hypothetical protein [Rubrivivax gelatinosus]|uniref:Uncharacterized protein n=1 Tax=Rubrivivax gelatinosus (strain NBRC 100245 / IL144) TaxID=983917 RepID=I0HRL3_RUBGI|nr:hypothetical protein [Rubrivivax gelatinosus]MBG6082182.1 hypothetical protein [Rubrivivax gelatinosus]BAL95650.1 hypothetical protein RGE_23090 [Rubrivivax gelatinosus IL144]
MNVTEKADSGGPITDPEDIMEVLEVIPSKTLKQTRENRADETRASVAAAPRAPAERAFLERLLLDDEAREAELEHVAVLGYN